ncbi:SDR family oxidoreductase [Evansella clarkii]|jgi:NAD(P)-dependent dehydrogenase (short-subunit alcohol dehydrogenase family)|uniref:SDR family oxidoreductase n=1 Tax=Evansella clarkii TaxID=79879 RepID=UPI000995FC64|nr:SDR family oxidoreductase [Evansella clarkii]
MDKKIALITGTSTGLGFHTALKLAENGYTVVAAMRNTEKKQRLEDEAARLRIEKNIDIVKMDVTEQSEITAIQKYVQDKYGKLDVLINNAGYSLGGVTEHLDTADWKGQFNTNLFGAVAVTKAFLPLMRKNGKGKIINIGSISGRFGFPGLGPYAASKFALEGFSESLRLELLNFNISVSIIEAGSYKTKIWEKGMGGVNTEEENEYSTLIRNLHKAAGNSAEGAAEPGEVAELILKICRTAKPKLRYQTGKGIRTATFLKGILPWSFFERLILRKIYSKK